MAKKPKAIWHATLETHSFSFEAFGESEDAARAAMIEALRAHARTYTLLLPAFLARVLEDIECHQKQIGAAYRDGEQITENANAKT